MKLEHPLIGMVMQTCVVLNVANKDIIFGWVPSHIGIRGSDKAGSAAKSALEEMWWNHLIPPHTNYVAFNTNWILI